MLEEGQCEGCQVATGAQFRFRVKDSRCCQSVDVCVALLPRSAPQLQTRPRVGRKQRAVDLAQMQKGDKGVVSGCKGMVTMLTC